ncbi:hypothetical protein K4K54_000198 [Colletotrichum sp. SAR 10_86]|nr:hypothetical protein K4K51_011952 [Colletotrichum sp. SAR 10_75]KAI8231178.1 hypothetical protein K4K54_000198 [Colletotrichum sp. SAR 10_86]
MASVTEALQGRGMPKIETIQNGPISGLLSYGSLLLVSSVVVVVLIANILERWLLRMVYGEVYKNLERPENEKRRRSFTYYHVGAIIMFALLCIGIYPVMHFLTGTAGLGTPVVQGHRLRIGDMLFTVSQVYSAYYVFELCFRTQFASPLSIAHHIGLLAITQTALSLFGNFVEHPEATIEFYMCMVWGAFDVVVELPIYVSMILWREQEICAVTVGPDPANNISPAEGFREAYSLESRVKNTQGFRVTPGFGLVSRLQIDTI